MELKPSDVSYISVTSEVTPHTKAGYEGTTVLPNKIFIEIDQDGTDMDYALPLTLERNTNKYLASKELIWKDANHSSCQIKVMTAPLGLTSVDLVNPMSVEINLDQSNANNLTECDLLGASNTTELNGIQIQQNNINISFRHLMSKLQITYTKPAAVEVNSVVLENTCVKGGYSFKDMKYDTSVEKDFGDITMFHEDEKNAAEAIFFPYTPASNPKLLVTATINDQVKTFECPIVLKSGSDSFVGGKCYVMSVTISETGVTGVMTMIKNWNASNVNNSIAREKILWVGTSIPAGGDPNYPVLVGQGLGCEVRNVAVGGSLVLKVKNGTADLQKYTTKGVEDKIGFDKVADGQGSFIKDETTGEFKSVGSGNGNYNPYLITAWDAPGAVNHLKYGGLIQSHDSAESRYRTALTNISGGDAEWVDKWMKKIKETSYESLILPYINGTDDYQCTTIILDHGFNDREKMVNEAGGHTEDAEFAQGGDTWAQAYFDKVLSGQIDSVTFRNDINANILALGSKHEISYIMAMNYLIREIIQKTNPNVRVIIGNYFSFDSPWVRQSWLGLGFDENFTAQICYNNEAVAVMNKLDIVNVYEHLYIPEGMFYNPSQCDPVNNIVDNSKFCPDGVHPSNPESIQAIADIYIRALRDILR